MGQRIAVARNHAGLTQEQLGAKFGITSQAVSGWERDDSRPEIHHLLPLARTLKVSVEWLLDDLSPPESPNGEREIGDLVWLIRKLPDAYKPAAIDFVRRLASDPEVRARVRETNQEKRLRTTAEDEAIWTIWGQTTPQQRRLIIEIANVLTKAGT